MPIIELPDGSRAEFPDGMDDGVIQASLRRDFPQWGGEQQPDPQKESGDAWRGAKTAAKQLPQLGYGLIAGAGAVAESAFGEGGLSTDLKKYGVEKYQAAGQDIAKDAKESDSLTYSWDQAKQGNYGAMVDWLQYGIGYGGVQALEALASGGIGAVVGKATLKGTAEHLASGMVAKETARIAATAEGATLAADAVGKMAVANVASKIGQLAGIGAQAYGMEGGEIGGGLAEQSVERGTPLSGAEIAKGLGATLAAGSLEFVGDKFGVDVMIGKSGIFKPAASLAGFGGKAARAGIAAAGTIPIEAGTEYLQTGLEEYGQGKEANILPWNQSEEAQRQAFDAAGLGGLGGGVMAVGGGLISKPQPTDPITETLKSMPATPADAEIQKFTDSLDNTDILDEGISQTPLATAQEAAQPIATPEPSLPPSGGLINAQEVIDGEILSGATENTQSDQRPTGTTADVLPSQPEDVRGNATTGNGVDLVGGGVATQGAQPAGGMAVSPVNPAVGRGADAVGQYDTPAVSNGDAVAPNIQPAGAQEAVAGEAATFPPESPLSRQTSATFPPPETKLGENIPPNAPAPDRSQPTANSDLATTPASTLPSNPPTTSQTTQADISGAIKPAIEQLIKRKAAAGQIRMGAHLAIAINKAKAAMDSGTGKAADFTKIAKQFKGKDDQIHTTLLSIANALEPAKAATKKPQKATSDLLQRIKQLGGIDGTLALDITGEPRAPGGWKFAFKKGGTSLDDLATMLASDGFMIDTSDVDGGVQQLRDMIRAHIGGERNFKAQTQEAQGEAMAASRDMDAMMQRAGELGINWRNLNAQQLSDAVYEAEDALAMEVLDAAENEDEVIALSDSAIDDEIDIPFNIDGVVDNAALASWLGEDDGQKGVEGSVQGAVTQGQEAGTGSDGGTNRQEAGTGQEVLQSYTNQEVLNAEARREQAGREEHAQILRDAAARGAIDQADIDARTKARTDNPENFQFGENSKQAAAPVADLFSQPSASSNPELQRVIKKAHEVGVSSARISEIGNDIPALTEEIGRAVMAMGSKQVAKPTAKQSDNALTAALNEYEETGEIGTVDELADRIESMIDEGTAPDSLTDAIKQYRDDQAYDRELSGRGDMDSAEVRLIDAIRATANESKPEEILVKQPYNVNTMAGIAEFEQAKEAAATAPENTIIRLRIEKDGLYEHEPVKTLYGAFVANGDGTATWAQARFPASKENPTDAQIMELAEADRLSNKETEAKIAEQSRKNKAGLADKGIVVGLELQGPSTYVPGKKGMTTFTRAKVVAIDGHGIAEVHATLKGSGKTYVFKADANSRLFEKLETQPDQEQQATAILDRANVTGKDRLDIMRDFKDGKHSLEDLEKAYPGNEEDQSKPAQAEQPANENDKFNSDLNSYLLGEFKSGSMFVLGKPGKILSQFGLGNLEIQMPQSIVKKGIEKHSIEAEDLRDLPQHIQNPLAVFASKSNPDARILLTEIDHPDGNLVVALHAEIERGKLVVHDIRSIHPKSGEKITQWVDDGLLLGVDKNKGRHLLPATPEYNSQGGNNEATSSAILYETSEKGNKQPARGEDAPISEAEREEVAQAAIAQADAIEPEQSAVDVLPVTKINELQGRTQESKIGDFGRKVSVRKDEAKATGSRIAKEADERTAWARPYMAMQVKTGDAASAYAIERDKPNLGKWQVMKKSTQMKGAVAPASRQFFATEQEALDSIPLIEVARNHKVYSYGATGETKQFGIYRILAEGKKRALVKGGFATQVEALEYEATNPIEIIEHKFELPERPWLDKIERTGKDRRNGKPVTKQMFIDTFAPGGVVYGNWLLNVDDTVNDDGQELSNHAYDGLLDLADTLGIPPKALFLNGDMVLGLGADGKGGKGAGAAHYSHDKGLINLTKINGAGSLAHEWWHSVDHYFSKGSGYSGHSIVVNNGAYGSKSEMRPELAEAIKSVIKTINYAEKSKTTDADLVRQNAQKRLDESVKSLDYKLNDLRRTLVKPWKDGKKPATEAQLKQWDALADKLRDGEQGEQVYIANPSKMRGVIGFSIGTNIRDMNAIYKAVGGSSFLRQDPASAGRQLVWPVEAIKENKIKINAKDDVTVIYQGRTDFFLEAKEIDNYRASNYWSTQEEMGARAFESYIFDKLTAGQQQSDYLVYGVENRYYAALGMKPYPEGSEREAINAAFDNLFATIQTKETDKGVALFSLGDPANAGGVDLATADGVISRVLAAKEGWNVDVAGFESFDALPAEVQKAVTKQYGEQDARKAKGVVHGGKVYLIAANNESEADVEQTILHEVEGHVGIHRLYGKELNAKLNALYLAIGGRKGLTKLANERGIAGDLSEYAKLLGKTEFTDEVRIQVMMDEALAHYAQHPKFGDRVKAIVGKIRAWLREHGFAKLAEYGETDLLNILREGRQHLKKAGEGADATVMIEKAESEAPLASRATSNPGQTVESVKQATRALRNRWLGFRKIEIVKSISGLPDELRQRSMRSGGIASDTEGVFDPKTKTVYLVADNLASPERAVWVAIHETVGHGGIRMLGKPVADALEFAGKNGYVKKLANAIAVDRGETFDARTHTDEAIAELAAATITGNVDAIMERYGIKVPMGMRSNLLGMIKRVVDAVRNFIGRVTGKPVEEVSDGDVLGLIRRMKNAVEGVEQGYDTAGVSNGVMASLPSAKDAFVSALGRWFSMPEKIRGSGIPLVVGKTPSTLLKVGAEQHPIQIDRGTLIKLVRTHSRVEPKGHGLTKEQIEKIPEQIADPIAIFESAPDPKTGKRRNDGRVVLTSLVDSQGEQVIVAIHLSKQVGRGNVINDVSSMHGREDKEIKSWVDAGLTLYFDDTRNETSPEWLTTGRLELPAVVQAAQSLGNKVLLKSEIVKDTDAPLFSSAPKQQSIPGTAQTSAKTRIVGDAGRQYTAEQRAAMARTGSVVTEKSTKETLQMLWQGAGKKLAQGIVDQFRPIRDLDDHAYTLMRLSKGATGAFEAFMQHGKLSIKDGAFDADTKGGVLEKVFFPLGKESTDFLRWVAGNRAERLAGEGKENLFTPEDIAAFKSLADGKTDFDYTMSDGTVTRDRAAIYRDSLKKFNEANKNVLDMAEQSGLIDGASRKLWEHEFYVPFYRTAAEEDGGVRGMNIKSGVIRQQAFQKLKGGEQQLNDLLENTLMNWAHLIDASAKNRAAMATLKAAEKVGAARKAVTGEKKTVWFMENGQKAEYKVEDPYLMEAISSLEYAGLRGPAMDAMSTMKHWLTVGVTASPFFKVRNLIRDSVQAIGTASNSDLSYNPLANVKKGFKLTDRKNAAQEYVSALAGGGLIRFGTMLEGSEAKRTRQLIKQGAKDSHILDNENKIRAFYDKYVEPGIAAYNELGNRGEEINRMALYDTLIKQGMDHATASLMARDLMDFSMQGTWTSVRFLTQIVPFMNARLQGLYKLGRATQDDKARFAIVLGATAMASLALLAAYGDDDDWKRREDWDRDNYWWFKIGGEAFRIPKPFEIGAIATMAERSAELMFDKEMTGGRFVSLTLGLAGNQLAMNPTPQLFKPIIDLYANKDSFTGRDIESMGMERLAPDYRFKQSTSLVARGISTAGNTLTGDHFLSPVQIDHINRAYFGWLGSFVVGSADMAVRSVSSEPTKPAIDYWKVATGGMVSGLEGAHSRYVSQMYDQARELEEAYGTWRNLVKEGKTEEAKEYREDNKDKLERYRRVNNVKNQASKINERIRMIERSSLDGEEKRRKIDIMRRQQDVIARRLVVP